MTNAFTCTGLFGDIFRDPDVAGAFSAPAFLRHMIAYERAWTGALIHTGIVPPDHGRAALAVIDAHVPDHAALARASDVDGLPVPELVRQLRAPLSPEMRGAIHSGATSQDVIDTAMVLTCLGVIERFHRRLVALIAALDTLSAAHGSAPLMGRTRMQAALPVTAGDRIGLWRRGLVRRVAALPALRRTVAVIQSGGPVGLRDAHGAQGKVIVAHAAQALDLAAPPAWHSDRAPMVDLGHWFASVAGALGKMGQDIALMAQQGVDEVRLDGGGSSSAMPHKQNPVRAEALVTLGRHVAGQQGILAQALIHEQERSGAAWALEWMTLPAMAEATGAALDNAARLLAQIRKVGKAR